MAIQSSAVRGGTRRRGFTQTEAMNAQLPYLNDIIAAQQARKMRMEDTAFREREFNQTERIQNQNMRLAEQQQKEQADAARAAMGMTIGQTGLGLAMNQSVGGKGISDIMGGTVGSSIPGSLNLANTLGAGLVGVGLGSMSKKKGISTGLGALGGALTGLIGSGPGQGLSSALSGGISGGIGGLLSGLL